MADLTRRRYGNFPQRRTAVLPRAAKSVAQLALEARSLERGSDLATAPGAPTWPEEHLNSFNSCEMEMRPKWSHSRISTVSSPPSEEWKKHPDKSVKALLKRLRIHPEAQRILGNAPIAAVSLERLNFQSVSLSSLQPVVCLSRLPSQRHSDASVNRPQQNGVDQKESNALDIRKGSPRAIPGDPSDPSPTETTPTSWTEPYCPDTPPSAEPEQDSGFDCESNSDQPYILCDSESDDGKTDWRTFYLDPDAEQTLVIKLDPEADQDPRLLLEGDSEIQYDVDLVQMNDSDAQKPDICGWREQSDSPVQQGEDKVETGEMESDDYCGVCLNGGDLLCCDRCPKVYHLECHIPPLVGFPLGDWVCTLCRSDQEPADAYDCENMQSCMEVKALYTLSNRDQRRCERVTLLLYCHVLSAPFHEPVSPLARNYYQIIRRPVDLSVIRKKLDRSNTLHYFTAEQFVDDILLMFKNCATFNYPDSEVAQAGRSLEVFFLSKLKEIFPDQTFPSASQDRTNKARLRWLSKKKKETHRQRKFTFPGKKYYL